jgi:Transglycosylase SLT domain
MPVNVPLAYQNLVRYMSQSTGLPYQVVACQANEESGFNANAVSPTGAQGWLQFEPGTWASVGHGSPFNIVDAAQAYVVLMRQLLREFHGSARLALAAYNAGPGNITAGLGYADTILGCAGSSIVINVGTPTGTATGELPPGPDVQPDDWSWYIKQAARHVNDAATSLAGYARLIGRL